MAAPAIFGATVTDLTLEAPPRSSPAPHTAENRKLADFPQPDHFAGQWPATA
jgi:hypothetical protein